jgi:hypothetical protein
VAPSVEGDVLRHGRTMAEAAHQYTNRRHEVNRLMPKIEFDLSGDEYSKLEDYARLERRAPSAQAEVFVLIGIKMWPTKAPEKSSSVARGARHKQVATNGVGGAEG